MKKIKLLFCLTIISIIVSAIFGSKNLFADIDVSVGIPSTSTVLGVSEINIKIKNVSNNAEVLSVNWADQILGSGWQSAQQYIELSANCNYFSWRVDVYTNNTTAETGYQKGGLLSTSTTTVRVPLGLVVSDSVVSIANIGEPGELIKNTVNGSTTTISAAWIYVKDKADIDDPNTTAWDESWTASYNTGYPTILYGGPSYKNLSYGISAVSPIVVYLEGLFNYIEGKMSYSSSVWFDLVY
ncbi:MAG: hypothetical protein ABID79_02945 [Elusimicrobiota bacterium]